MTTLREAAKRLGMLYFAMPSAFQLLGRHEEHIEQCRRQAVAVGIPESTVSRILDEVKAEASARSDGDLAWIDETFASRLYATAIPE